jgi:hypothetical protein
MCVSFSVCAICYYCFGLSRKTFYYLLAVIPQLRPFLVHCTQTLSQSESMTVHVTLNRPINRLDIQNLARCPSNLQVRDRERDAHRAHYKVFSNETPKRKAGYRARDSHFVYGHHEVIVDLLGNDGIKFIRRMGPNKVACPGSWRLERAVGATSDKAKIARDLAQFRLAHVERIDIRLNETDKSRERLALSCHHHNQHSSPCSVTLRLRGRS